MNKNVVITILLVIILCLGGYLIFDKVIDKNDGNVNGKIEENGDKENDKTEENVDKENDKDEVVDYDLQKAQELMDLYLTQSTSEIFKGLTDKLKLRIAYQNLNYSTYPEKLSYDEINKIYKELFGKAEAPKQNFSPNGWCDTYVFNSEQNSYIYNKGQGCGGAVGSVGYSIKSAAIQNSKLDIVVYSYMIDPMGNLYQYIIEKPSNGDDSNYKIADLNSSERIDDIKLTDEALEKYKDKMDTFTFRFEKYNDNYVLKDVFKN